MRIVIAEDSVLLREGLAQILARAGHEVVAQVGNAPSLLAAVRRSRPDLVITDVRMPPDHSDEGLRAALRLRAEDPDLPIFVLSQYVGQAYADELLESSGIALGYLLKDRVTDVSQFTAAVEQVAAGGVVIDPEVVRRLLARKRRDDPIARLTVREMDVLTRMAEGRSNAAIARELLISEVAVSKHIGNLFGKLGLAGSSDDNRRVLAVLAYLRSPG
ncbi:response regulator transcription factor [Nonomuraea jiangxiensis]|uniref:response regulator transcription factor n=1 Tax=Nonomuraea jiangxiensis TaxID=633440 RepID=UPI000B8A07B3|nr:response regulator transcription factor [Nonomuraea jiangxiensis]